MISGTRPEVRQKRGTVIVMPPRDKALCRWVHDPEARRTVRCLITCLSDRLRGAGRELAGLGPGPRGRRGRVDGRHEVPVEGAAAAVPGRVVRGAKVVADLVREGVLRFLKVDREGCAIN